MTATQAEKHLKDTDFDFDSAFGEMLEEIAREISLKLVEYIDRNKESQLNG